jgi:hypothetical protein
MAGQNKGIPERRDVWRLWLERLAPFAVFAFKLAVSAIYLRYYLPRFTRLMYIADGPARGIEAYRLAYGGFELFPTHQFLPMQLWLWAGLLKIYPDIYWTGTALNVAAAAGTTVLLYLLGRELAGPVAGAVAAILFIFSPVHHFLTLSEGMAESIFFFWNAAGIYLASRAAREGRGAWAAGLCFGAAALTRYESAALLILYSGYRLFRARPRGVGGWLLWAAPVAVVAVLVGHKATVAAHQGVWTDLAGVKADSEVILPHAAWFERVFYGLTRVWRDGRIFGLLGVCGAFLVWTRAYRTENRLLIWSGLVALAVGVLGVFGIVGLGFGPERHFSIVLMLLFAFAGLTVVAVWRWARRIVPKIVFAILLMAAVTDTARFDRCIRDYGYGARGPYDSSLTAAAEVALVLRDLWRNGDLKPDENVMVESGEPGATGVWRWEEYAIRAYSDHPLNFLRERRPSLTEKLPRLLPFMRNNEIRVAIVTSDRNRERIQWYYDEICTAAVVYENPTQTVVVLREGWDKVPDFASRERRDLVTVYDCAPDNL